MMKEINEAKRPLVVRFLRRVDKELAREAMENINQREAKVDRDPEPPALSSKPSKSKSEYDVVFKKEAYSPHNLKHKHLTNKEGFSQLLYRKDETIMRAQVC